MARKKRRWTGYALLAGAITTGAWYLTNKEEIEFNNVTREYMAISEGGSIHAQQSNDPLTPFQEHAYVIRTQEGNKFIFYEEEGDNLEAKAEALQPGDKYKLTVRKSSLELEAVLDNTPPLILRLGSKSLEVEGI